MSGATTTVAPHSAESAGPGYTPADAPISAAAKAAGPPTSAAATRQLLVGARAVHLHAMSLRDLDEVMAAEAASYSHPWTRGNFADALAAGHCCQVLRDRGVFLGHLVASAGPWEWHLLNLTVVPQERRRGLASALLQEVVTEGRRRGLEHMWLEVRASNSAALALYERHGLKRQGLRKAYYPAAQGREDAVLMGLPLTHGHAAAAPEMTLPPGPGPGLT